MSVYRKSVIRPKRTPKLTTSWRAGVGTLRPADRDVLGPALWTFRSTVNAREADDWERGCPGASHQQRRLLATKLTTAACQVGVRRRSRRGAGAEMSVALRQISPATFRTVLPTSVLYEFSL